MSEGSQTRRLHLCGSTFRTFWKRQNSRVTKSISVCLVLGLGGADRHQRRLKAFLGVMEMC